MKYIANPVEVDAYIIERVEPSQAEGQRWLNCSENQRVIATPGMLARMDPEVGDYVVVQSDGYVYLNPKEVFERKYRPATQ